jgi:hypothetical protein
MEGFNSEPIQKYLCDYFKVQDISQVKPYGLNTVAPPAYELVRDTNLCVKAKFKGKITGENLYGMEMNPVGRLQPKEPFIHTKSGQPCAHDLNNVMIVNYSVKHYQYKSSKPGLKLGIRLNFDHEHLAKLQETGVHEKAIKDGGGIPRIFRALEPCPDGQEIIQSFPIFEANYGYTNSGFTQTMALITPQNLRQGIVPLPAEVCLQARLPVRGLKKDPTLSEETLEKMFAGMKIENLEEEKAKVKNQVQERYKESIADLKENFSFFAIPEGHVLSWPFQCAEMCNENNTRFETFTTSAKDGPKYVLVPESDFKKWATDCERMWVDKCDKRPLESVGMELVGIGLKTDETVEIEVEITNYIHYWTYPLGLSRVNVDRLLPVLSPNFPKAEKYSVNKVAAMIREEEEEEEKSKKKINKK